tara:strand:- start:3149 stop:3973 length:825 start_codon:yes stop_codon:yes gene_type:complete
MSRDIKDILKKIEASPKKALGQNFLINKKKIQKIAEELLKHNPEKIIEIGPGLGAITDKLLSSKIDITCVEKDVKLCNYLANTFRNAPKLTVLNNDILKMKFKQIGSNKKSIVFGNLPYNIASQIIIQFVNEYYNEESIGLFMFQKEVAERILSRPKTKSYNAFTLRIQTFFNVEKILNLNESDFWPSPKIKSTLILLTPRSRNKNISQNYLEFCNFLSLCFKSKRKTLVNNLKKEFQIEDITYALKELSKKENVRAEELNNDNFIQLFCSLKN